MLPSTQQRITQRSGSDRRTFRRRDAVIAPPFHFCKQKPPLKNPRLASCYLQQRNRFMGDGVRKVEIIPDYFHASTPGVDPLRPGDSFTSTSVLDSQQSEDTTTSTSGVCTPHCDSRSQLNTESSSSLGRSYLSTQRRLRKSRFMSRLFSLRHLPFTGSDSEEKVEISSVELESLRSELADLEEKEAHLKAQLEHLDQILLRARLSGYLHIRTRWTAMPGEPPVIDDCEVDDWIPRFVVLQGQCLFFFLSSTDLSPQDTTLLSDIIEVGSLPDIEREDEDRRYCFYISTQYGLRMECSSISKIQVDTWLTVLQSECKSECDRTAPVDQNCINESQNCT